MDDNTITPYYLSLGEKLVKDLDGLDLLRALHPDQYQAMAEYIGGVIQDEADYALRSHERSVERRKRLMGKVEKPDYTGDNLVLPSTPTTGAPYVPTSEVVCRCADNRYCPVHDVQSSYTKDNDFGPHITYHPAPYAISREEDKLLDLTTPDGQAEFQRECEQGLWEIVNHPNFLELIHQSGGWRFNTVWHTGGTSPSVYGIMDVAERVLKGDYDEHR